MEAVSLHGRHPPTKSLLGENWPLQLLERQVTISDKKNTNQYYKGK